MFSIVMANLSLSQLSQACLENCGIAAGPRGYVGVRPGLSGSLYAPSYAGVSA